MSPGANGVSPAMVNVHKVGCGGGHFTPIQCGVATRDCQPRMCVSGRFAGEVASIELGDRGFQVVELEHYKRHDPLVGVDLDEVKNLTSNRLWRRGPRLEYAKG